MNINIIIIPIIQHITNIIVTNVFFCLVKYKTLRIGLNISNSRNN